MIFLAKAACAPVLDGLMRNSFFFVFVCATLAVGCDPSDAAIVVEEGGGMIRVDWPISSEESGTARFSLDETKPLIQSFSVAGKEIAAMLNPFTLLTVGERDLKNPAGWVAFFDDPSKRPNETFLMTIGKRSAKLTQLPSRTTIRLAEVSAGPFKGALQVTFFDRSPLIQLESIVSTTQDGRAILYDTGLTSAEPGFRAMAWKEPLGTPRRAPLDGNAAAMPLAVSGRALAAESVNGSLAIFPAPHQFFFPLDEAYNLKFVWHGKNYRGKAGDWGFGIRQSPEGDKRHVPWFNAPPNTEQRLGAFYLISSKTAESALEAVSSFTRGDHFKPLPDYKTFTSHFHVEHTQEFMRKQEEQKTDKVPQGLEVPGFVNTFKARGVDVAHMAEFHYEDGSRIPDFLRLKKLKTLHEECARLSDAELLVLPGEEPNVQLGGHWISLFPKPVNWTLARRPGQPFVEEVAGLGKCYHVGSQADVLKFMEEEQGLMWTAHPRIKASRGFPDVYKDRDFFLSDRFLGAAWKSMPADLSLPRLGTRVFELQDDMSNWGVKKHTPGEVDTFRMEPDFETYAHMNINYLKLKTLPRFADGWQPVLDALRGGKFFTSTGEVLIPKFSVGGKESGETLDVTKTESTTLSVNLEWTFPMAFAEIVSGDGENVFRQRIDLSGTESFGKQTLEIPLKLKNRAWVRFEAWDVAINGAYTQNVWLEGGKPPDKIAVESR